MGLDIKKLNDSHPLGLLIYNETLWHIFPLINKLWEELACLEDKNLKLSDSLLKSLDEFLISIKCPPELELDTHFLKISASYPNTSPDFIILTKYLMVVLISSQLRLCMPINIPYFNLTIDSKEKAVEPKLSSHSIFTKPESDNNEAAPQTPGIKK